MELLLTMRTNGENKSARAEIRVFLMVVKNMRNVEFGLDAGVKIKG